MSWSKEKLATLCSKIGSGVTPRGGESVYTSSGVSLIRSQNIYNTEFAKAGLAYIVDEQAQKMNGVEVKPNDVLLNITGDSVARCCLVPKDILPARVNQHVSIIRPHQNILDARFLMYYLVSPYMQAYLLSIAGSGGTRKALTKAMMLDFQIPLPKIDIQQKIASILSAYDDLIENNLRRIALLEESARLLYKEWFVDLRFPGHEHTSIVDGVPEGWGEISVPEIIDINPKEKIEKGKEVRAVPMACLAVNSTMISVELMEKKSKHSGAKFRNGDVILPRITPCLENGKTALVQFLADNEIACGSTEYIILRGKKVSSEFTYCLARTYDFRENAIKSMVGSSGRQRVQVSCLNDYFIPFPPTVLLEQFDQFAIPNFRHINILEFQNQKLKAARDILLPRLMNSEIAV